MTPRPDHELAARIGYVQFSSVRLVEGYDMGQVDYQLDQLQAAVLRGEPLAPLLDAIEFKEVRLREGYDIAEVDSFLNSLRVTAEPGVGLVSPAPESALDRVEDEPVTAAAPVFVPPPVIVEQRGLLARIFGRR